MRCVSKLMCFSTLHFLSYLKQKERSKLGSAPLNGSPGENVSLERKKPTRREDIKVMKAEVNSKPLQQEWSQFISGGVIHAKIPTRYLCLPKESNRSLYGKSNLLMLEIMSPRKLTMCNECRRRTHINLSAPPKCKGAQRLAFLQLDAFPTAAHSASLNNS